ncbi:MAG: Ni/Fe-hydrogenase, b-type cytochrome subunit [Bacteroidales bacterium]|nr:Ni/Fe-hydrogenase, b-type cytochrome subunit [Bacteroidales bacterium]
MIKKNQDLREVYVWQLPVRIFHWVNAVAIVGLCITGYIIGNPPAIQHGTPPADNYWFGIVRFVHFVCAMIFIVNFLMRCYWLFAGNKFSRWFNYIPLKKKQWRGIRDTLKIDVLLITKKPIYDIGHNSLAATTYGGLFIVMILQMITGLMMFSVQSNAFWTPFFQRMLIFFDGFFPIRNVHHWLMWIFILFAIIHIYLVFYHDYIEKNGIASSIIGGWKFIAKPIVNDMEAEDAMEHDVKILEKQIKEQKKAKKKLLKI